jgi:diadenosine tetraphosphate (Ap4A) HIT family hydrolase
MAIVNEIPMNECIFCKFSASPVLETELSYAIYDNFPVSEGHLLIIPKRHESDYFQLTSNEKTDLWHLTDLAKEMLDKEFKPDGYNIGININPAAGQTICHVHIHIIPRYKGDVSDPAGGVRGVIPAKQKY